jgi:type IV pilus assembly protein PilW
MKLQRQPLNMNTERQHGFTLIELMIAMVLGLIVLSGVISLFAQSQRSFKVDKNVAGMQAEARFALQEIARDLRMAGFLSEPLNPASIFPDAGLAVGVDCGVAAQPNWIYGLRDGVTGEINTVTTVDNATAATAAASFSCITGGEFQPTTDVLGTKRVVGNTTAVADRLAGAVYIRANGSFGRMYVNGAAPGVPVPFSDREYRPHIYYIRNFSTVAGDGIPSLCRKVLAWGAPPTMQTECIARGVEDLQVEFGLDPDGDGNVNAYLPNPTLTQMQQAISARVYLLVRTVEEDFSYTDAGSYAVSNAPAYAPADNFHRRMYEITVPMHNPRNFRRLGI